MRHKRYVDNGMALAGPETAPTDFVGRAVVYNSLSQPLMDAKGNSYFERFMPGAFKETLSLNDIIATVGHDSTKILGRRSAMTLEISDSDTGLDVKCPIGPYSYAMDLVNQLRRRDVNGMSFTFDDETIEWVPKGTEGNDLPICNISKACLYEVCFCADPAYLATSASMRSMETPTTPQPQLQFAKEAEEYLDRLRFLRFGIRI